MAMKRMCMTVSETDQEKFDRGRNEHGMTRSAYLRLLIAEHEGRVPDFIRNKELIQRMSELNNRIRELILSEKISDVDKLHLYEKLNDLQTYMRKIASS